MYVQLTSYNKHHKAWLYGVVWKVMWCPPSLVPLHNDVFTFTSSTLYTLHLVKEVNTDLNVGIEHESSLCTIMSYFSAFTSGENSAGEEREPWQTYIPACEVCSVLKTRVSVVRDGWELGPSRLTPSPTTTFLPTSSSHCATGLLDNPLTASEITQRILTIWPKLGAETSLMEITIAVFGTAQRK